MHDEIARDEAPVRLEAVETHIALVTLNRPSAMNSVTEELAVGLGDIVAETNARTDIRAVILTGGGGRAFCSGADLRAVARGTLDDLFTPAGGFAGFVHAVRRKPWIAAIDGYALAGGFEIVLACDLAVATHGSTFGLPEVRRGLMASAGGVYRLPRILPQKVANEMIATGQPIDARRAMELGLLNRVVDRADLLPIALELAREIAGNAPLAVQESLAVARAALDHSDAQLRTMSDAAQARLQGTNDYKEGATAFTEKRRAVWTGR